MALSGGWLWCLIAGVVSCWECSWGNSLSSYVRIVGEFFSIVFVKVWSMERGNFEKGEISACTGCFGEWVCWGECWLSL